MIDEYFRHECVIMTKTASQSSVGGDTGTWSVTSGSNFYGYIGAPGNDERISNGIETIFATNSFKYPVDVTLTENNRIKCLHADYLNQVFEVLPIKNVWDHHKKASLRLVN